MGAGPEQARASRQRAFWSHPGCPAVMMAAGPQPSDLLRAAGPPGPGAEPQAATSSWGTLLAWIRGCPLSTAALLVLQARAHPPTPLGLWPLASALVPVGLRAALFRPRKPGSLPPTRPQRPHTSWIGPCPTLLTCVFVCPQLTRGDSHAGPHLRLPASGDAVGQRGRLAHAPDHAKLW